MKNFFSATCLFFGWQFCSITAGAQSKTTSADTVISAGPEYRTSPSHQKWWGKNYREVWATPVRIPIVKLDTVKGGLTPVKAGGGNQTQSLQAETKDGKRYTFRTVNKTLGKVLPDEFLNTFIEDIVNDKVSMSHPYGAAVVPGLAAAAGIYHTYPSFVYLPEQKALDTFNSQFKDRVYLFEQKIDGNWKEADNLGNFEDYISTKKLLDSLFEDNANQVEQRSFLRSRLFDMLIHDWDRHEDQWEWGHVEKNGNKIYTAVPQDRDQAFFTYDGKLLKLAVGASGLSYFQPFGNTITDVKNFNYEQRNLDRFFLNQMTLADWQTTAREMQRALTDEVIENAVKRLPAEVYPLSGADIAAKLKARRNDLENLATEYYRFIAKAVDVVASKNDELIEVNKLDDDNVMVNVYRIKDGSRSEEVPFYSRTFNDDETKEIRIYGLSGNDVYTVGGHEENDIIIRLIGGNQRDSISVSGKGKVHLYDNRDNVIPASGVRKHLSNDSSVHNFEYFNYRYSKKGITPIAFYNNEDRFFVGIGYKLLTQKWRKEPFAGKQSFFVNYSISQKAFSVVYNGLFPRVIGKWDVDLFATYDAVRWTNFFGLGNNTKFEAADIDYYRARTEEWMGRVGVIRKFGHHTFRISGFAQRIRLINDREKFISKQMAQPGIYNAKNFAGAQLNYWLVDVNDSIVPTKGVAFYANASYTQNLRETSRSVNNFGGHLHLYIPIIKRLSFAIRSGASTVTGDPEFYQYASIGGTRTVKALRRDRFWGESAAYNSNELRFISNVKSHIFNGKLGLIAFYDNGRVWMPNESDGKWHNGYGGGVLISPFNKLLAEVTYGISKEEKLLQLRLSASF